MAFTPPQEELVKKGSEPFLISRGASSSPISAQAEAKRIVGKDTLLERTLTSVSPSGASSPTCSCEGRLRPERPTLRLLVIRTPVRQVSSPDSRRKKRKVGRLARTRGETVTALLSREFVTR